MQGNGAGEATPGATLGGPLRFQRADFPATVQVGVMAGTWGAPLDVRGEFDYVRFGAVSSLADCTAPVPAAD